MKWLICLFLGHMVPNWRVRSMYKAPRDYRPVEEGTCRRCGKVVRRAV